MALSSAEVAKVFKIFGIPQSGKAVIARENVAPRYPGTIEYDVSSLVAKLNECLAALNADQVTEVKAQLTTWDSITDSSPLKIREDINSKGTIVDHKAQRQLIKETIANLIGFAIPSDGFFAEVKAKFGMGGRILR